ncbi:MAG: histidine kinase internal region [Rhodanobacteraceae bacterium]|jgi:two-component system sensor histidine kinase AlgZ|nr:MAG: histidine kinase internal region [Rhodanobacteraceae bacterium]
MAETPGARKPEATALPDFCSVASVFTLVVVAELVVVIDALAPDAHMGWRSFSTATLFVVWLALLASLLLCRMSPLLLKWPRALAYPLAWCALVLLVAIASALVARLDHAIGTALTPASGTRFVVGNTVLAALLGAALLRYFHVLAEWRTRLAAVARAQFDALQARIRPHFLYNSMNTVAALVRVDPDAAERTVEDLSELFRAALGAGDKPSTLGAELALVDRYLAIEQLRLGDRLQVQRDIDALPLDLEMPSLLLQPLVENAVYHGIQPRREGGSVRIATRRVTGGIEIEIDNPLPEGETVRRNGHGLDSVRRRIAYHFGERGGLETHSEHGMFRVIVRLPCVS